jgi:hypothetical protein
MPRFPLISSLRRARPSEALRKLCLRDVSGQQKLFE